MMNISKANLFFSNLLIIIVASIIAPIHASSELRLPSTISRIAFGSCSNQNHPQPIWQVILKDKPDLFIHLGDIIYADTEDMAVMAARYQMMAYNPDFIKFRESIPFFGIWDDHDYGFNNAGKDYKKKEESKAILLNFLKEPKGSIRWTSPGIYMSYFFGPPGKRVQLILLDQRTFRDSRCRRSDSSGCPKEPNPFQILIGLSWEKPSGTGSKQS